MEVLTALWTSSVFIAGLVASCIWLGYWMGRNSTDRPVRSEHNLASSKMVTAEDEVTGDVFNDAMAIDEGETRTPTILGRRR